jgi:hypothetical protein
MVTKSLFSILSLTVLFASPVLADPERSLESGASVRNGEAAVDMKYKKDELSQSRSGEFGRRKTIVAGTLSDQRLAEGEFSIVRTDGEYEQSGGYRTETGKYKGVEITRNLQQTNLLKGDYRFGWSKRQSDHGASGARTYLNEGTTGFQVGAMSFNGDFRPVVNFEAGRVIESCLADLDDADEHQLCLAYSGSALIGTQLGATIEVSPSYRKLIANRKFKGDIPAYFYVKPTVEAKMQVDTIDLINNGGHTANGGASTKVGVSIGVGAF